MSRQTTSSAFTKSKTLDNKYVRHFPLHSPPSISMFSRNAAVNVAIVVLSTPCYRSVDSRIEHWRSISGSFLALGSCCCCCESMKLKELGWLFCFIVSVIRWVMILWSDLSVVVETWDWDYCVNISNISNFARWWFGSW